MLRLIVGRVDKIIRGKSIMLGQKTCPLDNWEKCDRYSVQVFALNLLSDKVDTRTKFASFMTYQFSAISLGNAVIFRIN